MRLPFGLRCSPTLLLLTLYKILILDTDDDSEILKETKKRLYSLIYMDNGSITSNSTSQLEFFYFSLNKIFNPYGFNLQQLISNNLKVQNLINRDFSNEEFSVFENFNQKLLGTKWNINKYVISTNDFFLNKNANTKRSILRSIASEYDIFNINGPLLNRAILSCILYSVQKI